MAELTLVVMAAGAGSRYGGLKQVEPIGPNGEWLIDYSVFDALSTGFQRVVFVIREEIEGELRARFDRLPAAVCRVDYVVQRLDDLPAGFSAPAARRKPWGTGHAVWSCRDALDGPFCVINADDFYGPQAFELVAEHLTQGGRGRAEHALIGYELSRTLTEHGPVARGVCRVDEAGYLLEIDERHRVAYRDGVVTSSEDGETWTELAPDSTVSMNVWGFGARFADDLTHRLVKFLEESDGRLETAEFLLPAVVGCLVAEGAARVRVLRTDEAWFGVTYRGDALRAREKIVERIASGAYPARLWDG